MIALKWLGFLIDRVGIQNLERVLEFYYEIGWISEEVLNQLLNYARGGTRPHHRDPPSGSQPKSSLSRITS
ncbi:FlaD/FlaE family flagellar protein [Thermococcus peptonophilus]|uniref:FlaD/FlaE family flagellar protein n=1 Tax=Thermococcus peptonophilus TaxID=53952 RepID=UPI0034676E86